MSTGTVPDLKKKAQAKSGLHYSFYTMLRTCVQNTVETHTLFCLRLASNFVCAKLFTPLCLWSLASGRRPPLWDLHRHGSKRYEGGMLPVLEAGGMRVWLEMQVSARPKPAIHANYSGERKQRRSMITGPKIC